MNDNFLGEFDTETDLNVFISCLKDIGFKEHHSSFTKGYVSRKILGRVDSYYGRFGFGFKIHYPCFFSTRFHFVTYYVKED